MTTARNVFRGFRPPPGSDSLALLLLRRRLLLHVRCCLALFLYFFPDSGRGISSTPDLSFHAERRLHIFDAEDDENVSAEERLPLILALLHFLMFQRQF